jgi:hypothetical protein
MNLMPDKKLYTLNDFHPMPARVAGERERRAFAAARAMNFQLRFLDDCIRAILPHDLIILGAPTGLGKTEMALAIAIASAMAERRVAYFALEAEPDELERRTKYAWMSRVAHQRGLTKYGDLNYTDWLLGRCDDIITRELDFEANQWMLEKLGGLRTFYRGRHFDAGNLAQAIDVVFEHVDLIVIDHLHYVDADDDQDEHRALGDTVKRIRDVSLRIGKPIILVAHLRKRDQRMKQIVPSLDDFHGSSNIAKIATHAILIERAHSIESPKWYLSPTFMVVDKDRRAGRSGLVALTWFDKRTKTYADEYTLGRLIKGGTEWEQLKPADQPSWARGHKQLEMDV